MNNWAIEAEQLIKKFPRHAAPNAATAADSNADEKKPAASAEPRSRWLFGRKKEPAAWFAAVDGVNLHIRQGEVFGLLGPNGAGKSTTIRMLCTLLEPTGGTAHVNGFDIVRQSNQVRQSLGTVLAGERSIYWKLTARENLEYFAALFHIPNKIAQQRIDELLERMELTNRANDLVEKYSTGMKQRVAIARALLARPPILLLDEPTLGLDPQAARRVRELVKELKAEGHTILLTTHYMEEADQLSERIGIIDQGKVIALGTPAELKRRISQQDAIRLEVAGWHAEMAELLRQLPTVENVAPRYTGADSLWEVNLLATNSRAVLPGIIDRLNTNGTRVVNMNVVQPTLEDVFIHLTGKALRD
jgi:ABC-2 type transport system ATP-binding protein